MERHAKVNEKFQEVSEFAWCDGDLPKIEEFIQIESFRTPSACTSFRSKFFEPLSYTDDMVNEDDQIMMLALLTGKRVIEEPRLFRYKMKETSMEQKLCEVIARALDIDAKQVTIDSTATDLDGWDSLGHLTILMEVEAEFGGEMQSNPKLASVVSVREIFDVING